MSSARSSSTALTSGEQEEAVALFEQAYSAKDVELVVQLAHQHDCLATQLPGRVCTLFSDLAAYVDPDASFVQRLESSNASDIFMKVLRENARDPNGDAQLVNDSAFLLTMMTIQGRQDKHLEEYIQIVMTLTQTKALENPELSNLVASTLMSLSTAHPELVPLSSVCPALVGLWRAWLGKDPSLCGVNWLISVPKFCKTDLAIPTSFVKAGMVNVLADSLTLEAEGHIIAVLLHILALLCTVDLIADKAVRGRFCEITSLLLKSKITMIEDRGVLIRSSDDSCGVVAVIQAMGYLTIGHREFVATTFSCSGVFPISLRIFHSQLGRDELPSARASLLRVVEIMSECPESLALLRADDRLFDTLVGMLTSGKVAERPEGTYELAVCGIRAVVRLLEACADEASPQMIKGCTALARMYVHRFKAFDFDRTKARKAEENEDEILLGLQAIASLAILKPLCKLLAELGACELVLKAMDHHGDHAHRSVLVVLGCKSVCYLSRMIESRKRFTASSGVLEGLMKGVCAFESSDSDVVRFACGALANLIASDPACFSRFAALGGSTFIAGLFPSIEPSMLFSVLATVESLTSLAARLFSRLGDDPKSRRSTTIVQQFLSENGLTSLLEILETLQTDKVISLKLADRSLQVFAALLSNSEECRTLLRQNSPLATRIATFALSMLRDMGLENLMLATSALKILRETTVPNVDRGPPYAPALAPSVLFRLFERSDSTLFGSLMVRYSDSEDGLPLIDHAMQILSVMPACIDPSKDPDSLVDANCLVDMTALVARKMLVRNNLRGCLQGLSVWGNWAETSPAVAQRILDMPEGADNVLDIVARICKTFGASDEGIAHGVAGFLGSGHSTERWRPFWIHGIRTKGACAAVLQLIRKWIVPQHSSSRSGLPDEKISTILASLTQLRTDYSSDLVNAGVCELIIFLLQKFPATMEVVTPCILIVGTLGQESTTGDGGVAGARFRESRTFARILIPPLKLYKAKFVSAFAKRSSARLPNETLVVCELIMRCIEMYAFENQANVAELWNLGAFELVIECLRDGACDCNGELLPWETEGIKGWVFRRIRIIFLVSCAEPQYIAKFVKAGAGNLILGMLETYGLNERVILSHFNLMLKGLQHEASALDHIVNVDRACQRFINVMDKCWYSVSIPYHVSMLEILVFFLENCNVQRGHGLIWEEARRIESGLKLQE